MTGEKEFIRRLQREVLGRSDLAWRDDCIFASIAPGVSLLYSIDRPEMIFGPQRDAMRRNGRWSAAVVANDVIACGQRPRGIAFDVGASTADTEGLLEWSRGVVDVCEAYGMTYEGGNVGTGHSISGVCWATASDDTIIRRRGAQEGDVILVTAAIGTGWSTRVWEAHRPGEVDRVSAFSSYKEWPIVRLDTFEQIWKLGCINAGMDLTDGLIEFAFELLEQSHVGVELQLPARLPNGLQFVADELDLPAEAFFLEAGYDTPFAHGWAVDGGALNDVESILKTAGVSYTVVGQVVDASRGATLRKATGERVTLPRYWDDAMRHRGSVETWEHTILPLFRP